MLGQIPLFMRAIAMSKALQPEIPASVKAAINAATTSTRQAIAKGETTAKVAAERVQGAMKAAQENVETAQELGAELMDVVDTASRTTIDGVTSVNESLMTFGKDAVQDAMDVSRKALEAKSFADVVALQTAFAERRINAMFQAIGMLNSIAQNNALAVWSPFATFARHAGEKASEAAEAQKVAFRTAA